MDAYSEIVGRSLFRASNNCFMVDFRLFRGVGVNIAWLLVKTCVLNFAHFT